MESSEAAASTMTKHSRMCCVGGGCGVRVGVGVGARVAVAVGVRARVGVGARANLLRGAADPQGGVAPRG
eukprot:scaffold8821_cov45-Phaeocystis_antarctica.AAC.2